MPKPAAAAARALRRLEALPEWKGARNVALYAALPGEIAVQGLRAALGDCVVLPRVEGRVLVLHRVEPGEPLPAGFRGIAEPEPSAPVVVPGEVDLFLVPGLLFDREGRRLGRGGGHYDRLLTTARPDAVRIGLCYADRLVERLPADPWDEPVDLIVTDEEVWRVTRPRARAHR